MTNAKLLLLRGLFGFLTLVATSPAIADECHARQAGTLPLSAAFQLDASYFTDAEALNPGDGSGFSGSPERLPLNRRAFCSRNQYSIASGLISFPNQKLSFENPAGSLNSGLCWWHTRFQRSASYLANFDSSKPKPTHDAAVKLIDKIIAMDSVVEIPGYANLEDFSRDYQKEMSTKLDRWAFRNYADGTWLQRLGDTGKTTPADMRSRMDAIYQRVLNKQQLLVLRIQIEGKGQGYSHALLLTGIEPIRGGGEPSNSLSMLNPVGYTLKVIDSNNPQTILTIDYRYGQPNMGYCPYPGDPVAGCMKVVPTPAFDGDLPDMEHAIQSYCAGR